MENSHKQIMNSLKEGYNFIKTMEATNDHRLSAFEHLLGRAEDQRKDLLHEIIIYNNTFNSLANVGQVIKLIERITKRIMILSQAPNPEPEPEPIYVPNKIQDIIEDLVILSELKQTRGDYTREAMLKERGEMLRKKKTEPIRKRLI
jgi:hypothetical protein